MKNLQIGDSNGNNPIFAEVRATAIVTSGAERAFPMTVLRSTALDVRDAHEGFDSWRKLDVHDIPNVDNQRMMVKT